MDYFKVYIQELVASAGGSAGMAADVSFYLLLVLVAFFAWLTGYLGHRFITPAILHVVSKTQATFDDYFFSRPVMRALWRVLPGILFYKLLPFCYLPETPAETAGVFDTAVKIYIVITFILLASAFLTNIGTFAAEHHRYKDRHLGGIIQFLKIMVYFVGGIVIVALLMGRDPFRLVAGLGAAATVLMLVFKDTILGLVAGIQLSANNMLKNGDWVTIEKLGINGVVEQVQLTTVKIRNFDNTISTVPPYTLVSESFQNWDGMVQRKARRVKRPLYIDVSTVRAVSAEESLSLKAAGLYVPGPHYMPEIQCVPHQEGHPHSGQKTPLPVNLTLFRHYAEHYLRSQPDVLHGRPGQWVMARQLPVTPQGLPVELWFYLSETEFSRYEDLASQYFEHLIAVAPAFGLRLYQYPGGADLNGLKGCS